MLITGHTGFKGGWLVLWLRALGARVHGFALDPPTRPSFFEVARVADALAGETRADLADPAALAAAMRGAEPEVVFHLAAQPLVGEGYRDPIGTFRTNVLGTAHVLEAVRSTDSVGAVVVATTDKVYRNLERGEPFGEDDPLGGHDPYSASKASAELVVAGYRSSYFGDGRHPARVASARAGNVIGGGDWSADRLVPDCLRAFAAGDPVQLRHDDAVRPWQHVLDPLAGYLALAGRLLGNEGRRYAAAWNFGPNPDDEATVADVAHRVAELWGGEARVANRVDSGPPEAGILRLDSTRARAELGWQPAWSLGQALERTVAWQRAWLGGEDMRSFSEAQIGAHSGVPIP